MGNNIVSRIVAVGYVHLKTAQGHTIILTKVRYIIDFRMSLISSGKLDDDGYLNIFGNGQWKLLNKSKVVAMGTKDGTLYKSKFSIMRNDVCIASSNINIWHKRLCHMREAMCAAIYVINLSPTTVLEGKVPDEVWFGKKISYNHLRVFGCKAFLHMIKYEISKLDNKSRACIFLNYGNEKFGYKLYDPLPKKVIRSRDVVFAEYQTINDITKSDNVKSHDDLVDFDSEDEEDIDKPVEEINTGFYGQNQENYPHEKMNEDVENDEQDDDLESLNLVHKFNKLLLPPFLLSKHQTGKGLL
ncbi:hypothetical protein LIER_07488 [Lithospermum erythrorhizon]|uniref:GAG-pre-integrase domain-containing protein n=1 Tax=Lithospermum erythrorhizon TaxID=34254 RepID=A0AAV3P8A8_LITER